MAVKSKTVKSKASDDPSRLRTPVRRKQPGESMSSRSIPTTAHHRTKIEAGKLLALSRRVHVAEMTIRGFNRSQIALELGVSVSQIRKDLAQIKRDWREVEVQHFEDRVSSELRKIDAVEREAWLAWERSKLPAKTTTLAEDAAGETTCRIETRQQVGDSQFLAQIDKCIGRRMSLLGLAAPKKTEVAASVEANVQVGLSIGLPRRDQMQAAVLDRIKARPELQKFLVPTPN